jgi:regulatory protein
MSATLSFQQALKNAATVCSKSEKCSSDIIVFLRQRGLSDDEIKNAIEFLIREKFIDDQRYALNFVHDKFRFNKWGKVKTAYMLRQKRIPENLIVESLCKISDEEYETTIRDLLLNKVKSIKGTGEHERKGKLIVFAQGRGFESDIAYRIASEIISNCPLD